METITEMQTAHFRRELLESVSSFANLQMHKLCNAHTLITAGFVGSELTPSSQTCDPGLLRKYNHHQRGAASRRVSLPRKALIHTLSSLTGTMPSNWQEGRSLLLSTAKTACGFM